MTYTLTVLDHRPFDRELADKDWWRTQTRDAARAQRIGRLDAVAVVARPLHKERRTVARAGRAMPAVDAMLDGLVDAGVLATAESAALYSLTMDAPIVTGRHGIVLDVHDLTGQTSPAAPDATWLLVPVDRPTFAALATVEGTVDHDTLGRAVARRLKAST